MSVQVKTPRENQFERTEFQCGERVQSNSGQKPDTKEENGKFQQPRKRRYSQGVKRNEDWQFMRRKRLKSAPAEKFVPPRFLLGGNISDPLNLNSLYSSEDGKALNEKTPASSPVPVPAHRGQEPVQLLYPTNVTDPLNLNCDDGPEVSRILSGRKKKRHNKHKKSNESASNSFISPQKDGEKMGQGLMEALKIDIEPEVSAPSQPIPDIFSKSKSLGDKIVSPVLPQTSPKSKKRRRAYSESTETTSSAARAILTSKEDPSGASDNKKCSPQKKSRRSLSNAPKGQGSNKKHPKFIHGNYNRYYGYRNPEMKDNRLTCFKPEWFEGKSVLDVGCNIGHLTLTLARDYKPSKIVGIDIDPMLIGQARKNVRFYLSSCKAETSKYPMSHSLNYGPIAAPPVSSIETKFPKNVLFMQGNYVLESDELLELQKEEYDVILVLSVTKWVHFNSGDDGLKRFFKRAYRQLRPGGKMILEPQPWSSYKKKKKLTEEIHRNFLSIKLRPEQFTDYLLSKEVGFSTCEVIDVPYNSSKGFRRPIQLFTKSDTLQNSPYHEGGPTTESLEDDAGQESKTKVVEVHGPSEIHVDIPAEGGRDVEVEVTPEIKGLEVAVAPEVKDLEVKVPPGITGLEVEVAPEITDLQVEVAPEVKGLQVEITPELKRPEVEVKQQQEVKVEVKTEVSELKDDFEVEKDLKNT